MSQLTQRNAGGSDNNEGGVTPYCDDSMGHPPDGRSSGSNLRVEKPRRLRPGVEKCFLCAVFASVRSSNSNVPVCERAGLVPRRESAICGVVHESY